MESERSLLVRRDVLDAWTRTRSLWALARNALVIGSRVYPGRKDRRSLYEGGVGVDVLAGPGVDVVRNLEDGAPDAWRGAFEHVDCVSVLEHSRKPWLLASAITDCLAPNGTLLVSVPWVWRFHGYPNDYWRFTPAGLRELFDGLRWVELALSSEGEIQRKPTALPNIEHHNYPYFARSEVFGIAVKP